MSDVVIVGGAATGWATAFNLMRLDPSLSVEVIERDPTLARSSTMLSDGNVRIQFNLAENILISQYAFECLAEFGEMLAVGGDRPDPGYRPQGNLFLVDEPGRAEALAGVALQQSLGCDSQWLDLEEVAARYPVLETVGVVGATFGPSDGPVDPSAVVGGYRKKALDLGAEMVVGEVARLVARQGAVSGVALANGEIRESDVVVVCAGAWSTGLLSTAGVDIPVEPVMRTVFVVAADVAGAADLPSVFLPSGVYMLAEQGDTFLMAWSQADDPVGFDFTPAPRTRFYDIIWPELVTTLPRFDRLEVKRSWAGLYAQNMLDANAIVGEHDELSGLFCATGFSGHGFQQCHAVGRYLGEIIVGATPTLDLSAFGPDRIGAGRPIHEHAGRII